MTDLKLTKERYDERTRYEVVSAYIESGNLSKVSRDFDIHYNTLKIWKKSPWWAEREKELRSAFRRPVIKRCQSLYLKALDAVEDRLENGDEVVVNSRQGQSIHRVKVPAKDLVRVAAELSTRIERIENVEDGISQEERGTGQDGAIATLAEQLTKYLTDSGNKAKEAKGITIVQTEDEPVALSTNEATTQLDNLIKSAAKEGEE